MVARSCREPVAFADFAKAAVRGEAVSGDAFGDLSGTFASTPRQPIIALCLVSDARRCCVGVPAACSNSARSVQAASSCLDSPGIQHRITSTTCTRCRSC
jgi:hypothetical protein